MTTPNSLNVYHNSCRNIIGILDVFHLSITFCVCHLYYIISLIYRIAISIRNKMMKTKKTTLQSDSTICKEVNREVIISHYERGITSTSLKIYFCSLQQVCPRNNQFNHVPSKKKQRTKLKSSWTPLINCPKLS